MIWKTVSDELSELKPYMNWYHSHANGVIKAGGACDLLLYDSSGADAATNTTKFAESAAKYDALIVRINPGQLSQSYILKVIFGMEIKSSTDGLFSGSF